MKWANLYEILDPNDAQDLERKAAFYEFHKGLDRKVADRLAYDDYKRLQMIKAAAYHLDGMDKAKAKADNAWLDSHYGMYVLLCQKLGYDPRSHIPPDIQAQRGEHDFGNKFVNHPADVFALKQ